MNPDRDDEGKKLKMVAIGAGSGGYPAAFRAAELGFDVTLVDPRADPGGVCLHEGCIPSKLLPHVARVIHESEESEAWGVSFGKPKIDIDRLRSRVRSATEKLTGGLTKLARAHGIECLEGRAEFRGKRRLRVSLEKGGEPRELAFDRAIIATGSQAVELLGFDLERSAVWDSAEALQLSGIPRSLLIIGGGYIGLEMGTIYAVLGSRVTLVEMRRQLLPGADPDLVEPLRNRLEGNGGPAFEGILLGTKVLGMRPHSHGVSVELKTGDDAATTRKFGRVLVAAGRRPNTEGLGLAHTDVQVDQDGFIEVDAQCRTAEGDIFAVGDVAGQPMLAHKATHEGRVAAEAAVGKPVAFDAAAIPSVVFTDPEIAWTGLTETDAKAKGVPVEIARFPWVASGRATAAGRSEGLTKILVEPRTERLLGVGITGVCAGELIGEATLAVEMGARVSDLGMTVHAHPTFGETLMEAAHVYAGHSTHHQPSSR